MSDGYTPLPPDGPSPPPSGILPNTFPDSVAVWTVVVDPNSGQQTGDAVMQPGSGPTPDPEPDPEPDPPASKTIGNLSCTINDVEYDLEVAPALTVLMNDPCIVLLDHDGDASPTATWGARNDYPVLISDQAEHVVMTLPQEGMATVTCTLTDPAATDSPVSVLLNFWVVDAKSWAELQSKEES